MNPLQWLFDHVLSERQVAALLVATGTVIVLQSWAWIGSTGDIVSSDKGDVIHYLSFNGQRIRVTSLKELFPFFVGGQILAVWIAVTCRSRLGLVMATLLPLVRVGLVEVQS